MTIQKRLLEAVEQKLLRPLDAQFALAVAGQDAPCVTLAVALLSRDAGEGHVCMPLSRLAITEESHPLLVSGLARGTRLKTGHRVCWLPGRSVGESGQRR